MYDTYRYIKKEWLFTLGARRLYRAAAWMSLVLLVALPGYAHYVRAFGQSEMLFMVFEVVAFVGAMTAGTTLVAMGAFWFLFDDSAGLPRFLWFFVMVFIPLGPALYCFFVYSRSKHFQPVESASVPITSN